VPAVGLTGGIGSGKSTVADLLVQRGAVLIDADRIAREVVLPDGPAFGPLVERFGPGILTPEGTVDRAALAAIVFPDPEALAALNAITHPAIGAVMAERRAREKDTDRVVVLDIPLLVPAHRDLLALDAVVVVDCPVDVALDRLVEQRGFTRADAEARIAAQLDREERRSGADFVIDNGSDLPHLEAEVDRVWRALVELAPGRAPEPALPQERDR
jgi:dephospho-CoA kinase